MLRGYTILGKTVFVQLCDNIIYLLLEAYAYSCRPMLEVCIPSSLDPTLAPRGCHVMSIFSQYTPYKLDGEDWSEQKKQDYGNLGNIKLENFQYHS